MLQLPPPLPRRRMKIDLNSDLGECLGAWRIGDDDAMLGIVSSAHLACGFHAGDAAGILQMLRGAAERGVAVGAHVAYPDSPASAAAPWTSPAPTCRPA